MRLREAVRDTAVLRTAALLSLVGGTTILVTDDKLVSTLIVGITVGVVVKVVATYGTLFGAAVWVAADAGSQRHARGFDRQPDR